VLGLALVGLSLLLMRGLTVTSHWTHLLPGFLVGGVGVGLINPPLASTAIAVVPLRQAGMGSGINSTFRQVGIATGIAALGSIFASEVRAIAGAIAALLLIRSSDFVAQSEGQRDGRPRKRPSRRGREQRRSTWLACSPGPGGSPTCG
jgi:MFS family permease